MKYQVRYKDIMSDNPMSEVTTKAAAEARYIEVKKEIETTWATPDTSGLYIKAYVESGSKLIGVQNTADIEVRV